MNYFPVAAQDRGLAWSVAMKRCPFLVFAMRLKEEAKRSKISSLVDLKPMSGSHLHSRSVETRRSCWLWAL